MIYECFNLFIYKFETLLCLVVLLSSTCEQEIRFIFTGLLGTDSVMRVALYSVP
jgi:hypothetical protein